MKALFTSQPGGAEVLIYGEQPEPKIVNPRDIIVRVRATALNRVDVFIREGSHGVTPTQFPRIAGLEYAGDVVQIGSQVSRFKVGDRVFGVAGSTHAELVRVMLDSGLIGHAEIIPSGLSYEEAAAIPVSFHMAWRLLHTSGNLRTGEDVLIMGAGSGTGSAGIILAKAAGARVITTAGTDEKLEKAISLGADEGINYQKTPDFSSRVRELTGNQGVDLVFEHIGAPVWEECFASMKFGGRLVICGVTAGHRVALHLGQLWQRRLSLIGVGNGSFEEFSTIARLAAEGVIRGIVDSVFPLEEGAQAHRRMEARDYFGKIVLRVP